jgi:hypothetical protein
MEAERAGSVDLLRLHCDGRDRRWWCGLWARRGRERGRRAQAREQLGYGRRRGRLRVRRQGAFPRVRRGWICVGARGLERGAALQAREQTLEARSRRLVRLGRARAS